MKLSQGVILLLRLTYRERKISKTDSKLSLINSESRLMLLSFRYLTSLFNIKVPIKPFKLREMSFQRDMLSIKTFKKWNKCAMSWIWVSRNYKFKTSLSACSRNSKQLMIWTVIMRRWWMGSDRKLWSLPQNRTCLLRLSGTR
jgi:hypothetical protein